MFVIRDVEMCFFKIVRDFDSFALLVGFERFHRFIFYNCAASKCLKTLEVVKNENC